MNILKKRLRVIAHFMGRHILSYRFISVLICILVVLIACNKDSDRNKPYEDPRYFGYMEARVNGELKTWEAATVIIPHDYPCFNGVSGGYKYVLPDSPETINIMFDMSPEFRCEEYYASYTITVDGNISHYGSRDICEDEDPLTPNTYLCHDVSFTMNPIGNDIYKGTFSFVASRNCGEEVFTITEGKFEVKTGGNKCDYH